MRVFNSTECLHSSHPVLLERHSFAWKIHVIADVFRDLGPQQMLIWFDSSIRFRSAASEFGPIYYDAMNDDARSKRMTPVQLGGSSGHTIQRATHPAMYTWLPMDPLVGKMTMREANFMKWRKTETSRQLLKWAVLCATTPECIELLEFYFHPTRFRLTLLTRLYSRLYTSSSTMAD